jgi:hypothetical protein
MQSIKEQKTYRQSEYLHKIKEWLLLREMRRLARLPYRLIEVLEHAEEFGMNAFHDGYVGHYVHGASWIKKCYQENRLSRRAEERLHSLTPHQLLVLIYQTGTSCEQWQKVPAYINTLYPSVGCFLANHTIPREGEWVWTVDTLSREISAGFISLVFDIDRKGLANTYVDLKIVVHAGKDIDEQRTFHLSVNLLFDHVPELKLDQDNMGMFTTWK